MEECPNLQCWLHSRRRPVGSKKPSQHSLFPLLRFGGGGGGGHTTNHSSFCLLLYEVLPPSPFGIREKSKLPFFFSFPFVEAWWQRRRGKAIHYSYKRARSHWSSEQRRRGGTFCCSLQLKSMCSYLVWDLSSCFWRQSLHPSAEQIWITAS